MEDPYPTMMPGRSRPQGVFTARAPGKWYLHATGGTVPHLSSKDPLQNKRHWTPPHFCDHLAAHSWQSSPTDLPVWAVLCSQAIADPIPSTVSHLVPLHFVQMCTSAVCGGGSCQLHPVCLVCSMLLQPMAAARAGCEGSDAPHRQCEASLTTSRCSAG